jgi:hypothetical protein
LPIEIGIQVGSKNGKNGGKNSRSVKGLDEISEEEGSDDDD